MLLLQSLRLYCCCLVAAEVLAAAEQPVAVVAAPPLARRQGADEPAAAAGPGNATVRWSYLPSLDAVRFLVLQPPAAASRWHVALTRNDSGAVLAQQGGTLLPLSPLAFTVSVPRMEPSAYALTFTLSADATVNEAPTVVFTQQDIFKRTRRPWEEGNTLGKDDVVIPPFTHDHRGYQQRGERRTRAAGGGDWAVGAGADHAEPDTAHPDAAAR